MQSKCMAAFDESGIIKPHTIERREPGPNDVLVKLEYCGVCHSDIHTARSEWGPTLYPCVPGHEMVGHVVKVGKKVKRFKIGEPVGVGCFVDSCGKCKPCKNNEEQFCEVKTVFSYNSTELDNKTPTYGGYASHITVKDKFVLKIKKRLPLDKVAPLLCAGITTYSPLKRYKAGKGKKIGVVGLGGLGHMAVKLAKAMGAEVTVFSTSAHKESDAKRLGAKHFKITKDPKVFASLAGTLDLIIDTVSVQHDFTPYLTTLKLGGTMVLVGASPDANTLSAFGLIGGRKVLTGSLIGGIKETQEMLDFCAKKRVFSDIELITPEKINQAYDRTVASDVKYRFVVDLKTL